ncbi:methylated-DNA--[protein]-cysteine S-methyltransferase [Erysipelothrix anatis]|uniref:methylated-DNA--[protein]-cysteine S-methyltransferase n=1 Tax=Erysipelothrix anatis TaxID=2683713 RepID=UPI00135B65FA|nr:methylated-DNA--[protein]-cysteine S-methyltransferase [Erysipelothrix anatis]
MKYTSFECLGTTFYIVKDDLGVRYFGNSYADFQKYAPTAVEDSQAFELEVDELSRYQAGTLDTFSWKLAPHGTDFQKSVWQVLNTIPYGVTWSYSDVAIALGDVKKVRAVGSAIGKNPIMIVTPCHRVIGKDGGLHGFTGGLDLKVKLLDIESKEERDYGSQR